MVLSQVPSFSAPAFAEVSPLAKSTVLMLNGVSPYGFAHRGTPHVGDPISGIGLGGPAQHLTANGVKVPNSPSNIVALAEGNVAATIGEKSFESYGPEILYLTTRRGKLTLDLNPVSPGSNKVNFIVASGTGVFSGGHGTGTITFGILAKFHSNR